MAWIGAAIAVGGALLSSSQQGGAASDAASQQANAQNAATQSQMQMFQTQNAQQAPYRQAGYTSLDTILSGLGLEPTGMGAGPQHDAIVANIDNSIAQRNAAGNFKAGDAGYNAPFEQQGAADQQTLLQWYGPNTPKVPGQANVGGFDNGYFSHQFNANDLNSNLAPNYNFMLQQGLGATQNLANVSGGALGGNSLQGVTQFAENYAQNAYQQAYNNFTQNQSNIFNRLSTIAGLGNAANQQSAGLAGTLAPSIGSSIAATGAAQASGTVGRANAYAGGLNNALGWYQLGNFLNPGGGGSVDSAANTYLTQ